MHQIYTEADPHYTGRATVPVLWDMEQSTIVNNESTDILRMLDTSFEDLVPSNIRLYPEEFSEEIEELNSRIYDKLNNGVYKAGFASTQEAYDEAVRGVFDMLDELEMRLAEREYLVGDKLTETDVRTFVTLIRFDAAYHGIFKTNRRQIKDYTNLQSYMERIYFLPGIKDTVSIDHITRGYYSIKDLNPKCIRPEGPAHIKALLDKVGGS